MKKLEEKHGPPLKELFAELDAKYEESKRNNPGSKTNYSSDSSTTTLVIQVDNDDNISNTSDLIDQLQQPSLDSNSIKQVEDVINNNAASLVPDNSVAMSIPKEIVTSPNELSPTNRANNNAKTDNQLTSKSYQLHIPDGFTALYHSNRSDDEKEVELKKFDNYVTDSLIEEMSQYYPARDDISRDPTTNDIIMNKESFSIKFQSMFPEGRIFINFLQLRKACIEFFKHWNLLVKATGKSIRCSYSHTPNKKKSDMGDDSTCNTSKRQSTSSLVQCPFHVKWTLVDHKSPIRHDIFYKVKVSTLACLDHSCMMSHMSYTHALKKTNGHSKIDLDSVNTAVSMLKMYPSMPAKMLRPLLKNVLPCTTCIDSKLIDNFRRRVALHHAKNPSHDVVTMDESRQLVRNKDLDKSDFIGMNDDIVKTNLSELYTKIMKNDSRVWSALQFLLECKNTIDGFDFRVLRSKNGKPTAILYMTARMRYNLLRFGNIFFIDGQKRKFNQLNWPYIGPVIKNSDNRIGVTCEAIVTAEDNDTYTWVFKSMLALEPRWSLSNIQIIYGDGLVSQKLLTNLGITDTCILHGDFYHLYKENWPKSNYFGSVVYKLIKPQLYKMLVSKDKTEWDTAYEEACKLLDTHPLKLELLQKIYSNPNYYAGYVTRTIVGNLNLNGTVHAEQNHSSIVNYNGDMIVGNICKHLKSLCERQQQICNKENDYETDHRIRSECYKPILDGELARQEFNARQILSRKPHSDYFVKQLKSAQTLQSTFDEGSLTHSIWPAGTEFDPNDSEHVVIKVGDRCSCWRRVDYDIQCKHELKICGKFKKEHWGHRWYSRHAYNAMFPNMCTHNLKNNIPINNHSEEHEEVNLGEASFCEENEIEVDEHSDTAFDRNTVESNTVFNSILDANKSQVSYKDVLEIATDLCRTVSEDAKLCKVTYATIFEWITKLREGDQFEIKFVNKTIPSSHKKSDRHLPSPAVITPAVGGRRSRKRLKSSEEIRRSSASRNYEETEDVVMTQASLLSQNNSVSQSKAKSMGDDTNHVARGSKDKKYCFLCRQQGCSRWTCEILKGYEKVPGRILHKGHQESRDKLINLLSNIDNHVMCHKRKKRDKRMVYNDLPKKIKAIIIEKKYVLEDSVTFISKHDNICIECTILGDFGQPMEKYKNALFQKNCVIRHVGKSAMNLIVDNIS